jgi:hypothetical protein
MYPPFDPTFGPPQLGLRPEDFTMLRMQSLYDPQNVGMPTRDAGDDMMELLAQLYKPENKMSDLYQSALQQMPQREEPSKMRKIGAAIAGLGAGVHPSAYSHGAALGFESTPGAQQAAQEEFAYRPYNRKMADFKTKTDVLAKGANEEEKSNINKRALALGEASRITSARRAEDYGARVNAQNEKAVQDAQRDVTRLKQDLEKANADRVQRENAVNSRAATAADAIAQREQEARMKDIQHSLDRAVDRLQLTEQARFHNAQIAKMEADAAKDKERNKLYAEMNKDRREGKNVEEIWEFDAENNPIGRRVKTTTRQPSTGQRGAGPGAAPPAPAGYEYVLKPDGSGWTAVKKK